LGGRPRWHSFYFLKERPDRASEWKPEAIAIFFYACAHVLLRNRVEHELHEKLDFRVEMQTRKNRRLGMTAEVERQHLFLSGHRDL
jgi:hypothetical protein